MASGISQPCFAQFRKTIHGVPHNNRYEAGKKMKMPWKSKWLDWSQHVSREPVILALLTALAFIAILCVVGLTKIYNAQQDSLANRWYHRGEADLKAQRFPNAVLDFHTALLYSRDNYAYELNLAEALLGEGRTEEASAYLLNLRDRQPDNGEVNLALARTAVHTGQAEKAIRYYHNAIYAAWPDGQESERARSRLELIHLLLRINDSGQAQSELVALAANLGADSPQHTQVGMLFLAARDYEPALEQFEISLSGNSSDVIALAGAGRAAFELQRYKLAQRYLTEALSLNPHDSESAARLKLAGLILRIDPYAQGLSAEQQDQNVEIAFAAAGERLLRCGAMLLSKDSKSTVLNSQMTGPLGDLAAQWVKLKPHVTRPALRRDRNTAAVAINLVFRIESQTLNTCSTTSETDAALLLIAKLHERS